VAPKATEAFVAATIPSAAPAAFEISREAREGEQKAAEDFVAGGGSPVHPKEMCLYR